MNKYNEEDIGIVQDVVEAMIQILDNKENFLTIFLDKNIVINSFKDLYELIFIQLSLNLKHYSLNREINETKIFQGITTALLFYITTFLVSKGLKKHNYKISVEFYYLLPYSMQENIGFNQLILGIRKKEPKLFSGNVSYSLDKNIPLLKNKMIIFGGDKSRKVGCPYTQNKNGKQLNQNLSDSMLTLLELLYSQILQYYEKEYENSPISKTPDFVNLLLGRFEINEEHLLKYPQFFQRI